MSRSSPAPWQRTFIESIGAFGETTGLPPSYLQVFAWLVVCDPPEQSVDQVRSALGLSSGAVSMAAATLIRAGLVERVSLPGDRRHFYRFRPGGWARMLELRIEATRQIRVLAEETLARAPDAPDRLAEMRAVYAWFEEHMTELLATSPWTTTPRRTRR
jgi:DNA-binding transcriptional regulator GbsR (MarR family)